MIRTLIALALLAMLGPASADEQEFDFAVDSSGVLYRIESESPPRAAGP
jgi:hypothetical protein